MAMSFAFNIVNDELNWNPGTMFFYNGDINEIQGIHNQEEMKYLQSCWKETTGRDLKLYGWSAQAPVYVRLFGTLQPSSKSQEVLDEIKKLEELLKK